MRFRRWTGEGTIAVQLQRQAGDPQAQPGDARRPDLAVAERRGPRRLPGDRGPGGHDIGGLAAARPPGVTRLTIRLGSGDHATHVTLPVAIGRPMPADADIVGLQLTRRLVAGKERASIAVTMRVPTSGFRRRSTGRHPPGVAVHADGTIRVAVVEGPAAPPERA